MEILIYLALGLVTAFAVGYLEPKKCEELYADMEVAMTMFVACVVVAFWPVCVGILVVRLGMEYRKTGKIGYRAA